MTTHPDIINADLLAFVRGDAAAMQQRTLAAANA